MFSRDESLMTMLYNYETIIIGYDQCILVPYRNEHVKRYHDWMFNEDLLALTASEPLSIEEEYDMQKQWKLDNNKVTFIILSKVRAMEIISSYINNNTNNNNVVTSEEEEEEEEETAKQQEQQQEEQQVEKENEKQQHEQQQHDNNDDMECYIRLYQILSSSMIRTVGQQHHQEKDVSGDGDHIILNRGNVVEENEIYDNEHNNGIMTVNIEKLITTSTTPSSSSSTTPPKPYSSSVLFVDYIPSSFISMTLSAMIGDVNLFISSYDDDDDDEENNEEQHEKEVNEVERKQGEIDIMIAEVDYRGRGIGVEVISCFMDYISSSINNNMNIYRYYCKINETNISSISLFHNKLLFTLKNYTDCFHEYEYEFKYETINELHNEIRKRLLLRIIHQSSSLFKHDQHDIRFDNIKRNDDDHRSNDCNTNHEILPNGIPSTNDASTTETMILNTTTANDDDDTYNITMKYPTLLPMLYCPSTD